MFEPFRHQVERCISAAQSIAGTMWGSPRSLRLEEPQHVISTPSPVDWEE